MSGSDEQTQQTLSALFGQLSMGVPATQPIAPHGGAIGQGFSSMGVISHLQQIESILKLRADLEKKEAKLAEREKFLELQTKIAKLEAEIAERDAELSERKFVGAAHVARSSTRPTTRPTTRPMTRGKIFSGEVLCRSVSSHLTVQAKSFPSRKQGTCGFCSKQFKAEDNIFKIFLPMPFPPPPSGEKPQSSRLPAHPMFYPMNYAYYMCGSCMEGFQGADKGVVAENIFARISEIPRIYENHDKTTQFIYLFGEEFSFGSRSFVVSIPGGEHNTVCVLPYFFILVRETEGKKFVEIHFANMKEKAHQSMAAASQEKGKTRYYLPNLFNAYITSARYVQDDKTNFAEMIKEHVLPRVVEKNREAVESYLATFAEAEEE